MKLSLKNAKDIGRIFGKRKNEKMAGAGQIEASFKRFAMDYIAHLYIQMWMCIYICWHAHTVAINTSPFKLFVVSSAVHLHLKTPINIIARVCMHINAPKSMKAILSSSFTKTFGSKYRTLE